MRLLLDTNILIWALDDTTRLTAVERNALVDPDNVCTCSLISLWEIAIKSSLGKLTLPLPVEEIATALSEVANATILDLSLDHVFGIQTLPWHHRDPFDRMLIAQARHEGMTIVTRDRNFARYDVPVLAA